MPNIRIETERLELVAGTPTLVRAEIGDRQQFSHLLQAQIPRSWPPEYIDTDAMNFSLEQLLSGPEQAGWWCWYFVRRSNSAERVLIGTGGFKGAPDENRTVEIGYSVLPEFQKQGLGSEAVAGLVRWAGEHGVTKVQAETLPELDASIRVLEKNGFVYMGNGSEEGVILYRKDRP